MVRLRYTKNESGNLVTKDILVGKDLVKVTLYTSEYRYEVTSSTGETVSQGTAANFQELKKQAKLSLKELGVSFDDEVRTSKFKVEPTKLNVPTLEENQ